MNKEEILRKYRSEQIDEGRDHINFLSDSKAFVGMCIFSLAIMLYQNLKGLPFGDIAALLFFFLAVGGFHRHKETRDHKALLFSVVTGCICLASITWYVVQTF